ncbi:MAG: DinB family protein [Acidobacteria bacterium]|nr:DinB family protein [Acidobacteriota bacterium]
MASQGVATLGPELDAFRAQFEHMSAEADALVEPLSDQQFTWQPGPDVWSVSLCLDHLNATARQYLPAMDDGIAEAVRRGLYGHGPYSYNWIGKMMVYFVQPASTPRTRAPIAFRPTPGRSRHDVMAAFRAYQVQYIDRLHQANGLDLARARVTSPVMRWVRMPLGSSFAAMLAHERRHLAQARRVISAQGFPL